MSKYSAFPKIDLQNRTWPDRTIEAPPIWCSVDLRDGNQALAIPMNLKEKSEFFGLLVDMGFREIEVGFPSASRIDFDFLRSLVDGKKIPTGVAIQVLTQARDHLIRRTIESLKGVGKAIIHLYNSTSPLHREITFGMTKGQIKDIAVKGTKLVKSGLCDLRGTEVILEYSPESFSSTEVDFAVEVCQAVRETWLEGGLPDNVSDTIIMNLPLTVEETTPNIYADQIEYFCRNIGDRQNIIVSLHTHNDRGTGVAATELGLLAGADRVEGTLFGNGERTGNLDIINVALNMYSRGCNPGLDVFNLPKLQEVYERCTGMKVPPRHPYAGELVFTAFSGSHQDSIKKGLDRMKAVQDPYAPWKVPYLLIDPKDVGRDYQAIIRINSQSGKGGVAYILQTKFGYELPKNMHPAIGKLVNDISDNLGRELDSGEVFDIFSNHFLNVKEPLELVRYSIHSVQENGTSVTCDAAVLINEEEKTISGSGNGPISAFVNALQNAGFSGLDVTDFHEQSLGLGSRTEAVAYVNITTEAGGSFWGAGKHTDITTAGILALISAYNISGLGTKTE